MIYLLTQSSIIFINIDLFIDTIINHIQKWESHTFILEPLFEPDQLTINSSVYIPTIRHVILVAHNSNTKKILYKKHLFTYYKIPSQCISDNSLDNKHIISSDNGHSVPDKNIRYIIDEIDIIYNKIKKNIIVK